MTDKTTFAKVTFDGAPPPGVINLGIGQPSADLLPVNLLREASEDFLRVAQPQEFNFVIAADEVYQMLPYFGEVPPALGTMIDRGNVLSMGTFSKIVAPGLRLGWIQAPDHLLEIALDSGWLNSGGRNVI